MSVNVLRARGIYTTRKAALKAAANWYRGTLGYQPVEECVNRKRVVTTSVIDISDMSIIGRVQYDSKAKTYTLYMCPRCPVFRHIEVGDKVRIASKGWGVAVLPNLEQELWVCTHGIASGDNVISVKKSRGG